MTETRTEYVPQTVDVITHEGQNFEDVNHDQFAKKAGMVYLAGVEESEDGSKIQSVMIPSENIKLIREHSEEEEVEVPSTPSAEELQQEVDEAVEDSQVEEEEETAEEEEERAGDSYHLPDMNVSEIREIIDGEYNVDYLEACVEEDDRKTAVELYEERIDEIQS